MHILSIETSTHIGSLALHIDGALKSYHENHQQKSHSEYLAIAIKNMFEECNISSDNLDAVAISKGPGSYTGLRIGVSLAKGICFGTGAKLVSVSTLHAMAYQLNQNLPIDQGMLLCPMIDARRMEVYCQLYDHRLIPLGDIEAKVIDEHTFSDHFSNNKICFFGNGATKCKSVILNEHAVFAEGIFPSAKFIGEIAYHKLNKGETENVAYFEPFYLKEFIAKKPSGKNLV